MRPVLSRFLGSTYGPLNITGMISWFVFTMIIIGRVKWQDSRDMMVFNQEDNPGYWYSRYRMIFPPQLLNNRTSAHFLEIDHIFTVEMFKKYTQI